MNISDCLSAPLQYSGAKMNRTAVAFAAKISGDSAQQPMDAITYYQNLCKDYPNIEFRLGDRAAGERLSTSGQCYLGYNNSMNQIGDNFGGIGQCSISLDISVIEHMQRDPKYAERVRGMIENSRDLYSGYGADALADGYRYVSVVLEDEGGELIRGVMQSNMPYSIEEEVKKMWSEDALTDKLIIKFEAVKNELPDFIAEVIDEQALYNAWMSQGSTTAFSYTQNHGLNRENNSISLVPGMMTRLANGQIPMNFFYSKNQDNSTYAKIGLQAFTMQESDRNMEVAKNVET